MVWAVISASRREYPRKEGAFFISILSLWLGSACNWRWGGRETDFSSMGKSKNAMPSFMTFCVSLSGMPTFFRYKKPTSRRACRSWSRNCGLVAGSLAWDRSRIGMESNDIVGYIYIYRNLQQNGRDIDLRKVSTYERREIYLTSYDDTPFSEGCPSARSCAIGKCAPHPTFTLLYPSARDELGPAPVRLAFIPRVHGSLIEKDVFLEWIRKFDMVM